MGKVSPPSYNLYRGEKAFQTSESSKDHSVKLLSFYDDAKKNQEKIHRNKLSK
jgi:hypothetical protein